MDSVENRDIRNMLETLTEKTYQKFASSLIPNIDAESLLGVRLGALRKIAKKIAAKDWRSYLLQASDESFEEIMLQGMVIGYAEAEPPELFSWIERFLPKIDNWSVCDSFCSGLKAALVHREAFFEFLMKCLGTQKEYYTRFSVVMFIFYYMEEQYALSVLRILEQVESESYYVKMAVAWAVSVYFAEFQEITMPFLIRGSLENRTYQMTLNKICESRKVGPETKKQIRKMKKL